MKNKRKNNKGISLIVLVITIIVIIIIATSVILSINNSNPITSAKQATLKNDVEVLQSSYTLYITNKMAEKNENIIGNMWIV